MDEELSKFTFDLKSSANATNRTKLDVTVSITITEDPLQSEDVVSEDVSEKVQLLKSRIFLITDLLQLERMGLSRERFFILNETTGECTYEYVTIDARRKLERTPFRVDVAELHSLHFLEFEQFIVLLTKNLAQGIADNKPALDILTDFATIIGATIPLTGAVLKILHLDKYYHKSEKIPTVTISIGDVSVTVTDEDLKDAEHTALNVARKLLKEHPEAIPSTIVNVSGKLIEPPVQPTLPATPQVQLVSTRPPRKPHKKRSK